VNGGGTPTVANLTPTSPNCTAASGSTPLTCSVPVAAPIGADTFTVTTYDQTNAAGNALSSANVAATIIAGQANTVSVILNGVIASIQLILGDANPPQGTATTISLTVNAMDADGNVIIGPGNYNTPIALSDSDSTYTSLSTTSVATPGLSVTVSYNGGDLSTATFSASASGVPSSAITNAVLTSKALFREYPIPTANAEPYYITPGPDGNLWFTEAESNKIGRITPSGGITEFTLTAGPYGNPFGITAGPDGNIWFTELTGGNFIGRITPNGAITQFLAPPGYANPRAIAVGPDNNLWFTAVATNNEGQGTGGAVGNITPNGLISMFTLSGGVIPWGITSGSDGNLWSSSIATGGPLGTISPNGTLIAEYAQPDQSYGITAGPDGNIWFTEADNGNNSIGIITPGGSFSSHAVPPGSYPVSITAGPDGNLWFTDIGVNAVDQITTAGSVSKFTIPTSGSQPWGITAGPDGNIWFTELFANKIGVFLRSGPTASPQSLAFTATAQTANVTVAEPNYSGTFSASSSNTACASVSPSSGATTFTVTANGAGTCTISFTDGAGNTGTTIAQVTTTGIGIQAKPRSAPAANPLPLPPFIRGSIK
jgi:streptogramin lyase